MSRKYLFFPLLLVVLMSVAACQSLNQVTPEVMDDEAIELEVRARMAEDIELKAFELGVDVNNEGVVTLTGHVDSNEQRLRAGQAAREVEGVTAVINNIHVQ